MDSSLQSVTSQFPDFLFSGNLLSKVSFGLLCLFALIFLLFALRKRVKKLWDCTYFIWLCAAVFVWALFSALSFFAEGSFAQTFKALSNIGMYLTPALLCLHVWQQVSYKNKGPLVFVLLFVPPAFLIVMLLQDTFFPQAINSFVAAYHAQQYSKFIFFVYAIAVLVKAYLLCFNVFYHMPPRMKRSTRFMLFSISMLVFFVTLSFLWHEQIAPLLPQTEALNIVLLLAAPVVFFCVLYPLFEALRFMPASDVIVTSREFVVGSLATTILVLSRTMRILDWNKKGSGKEIPLLKPLFRESFEAYRQRLLAEGGYRVSPHNENILTLMTDEQEMHFLLQIHEAKTTKKHFGYIVEVTEVSPIYTTLRYFEEIAYLDTLTKLYNRNAYITHVSETIKAENMPLLILVGDVNHLKQINDTHGHLVGDRLLTIVSDIISQAVDENAFVARVGGDEFVLLLPRGSKEVAESFIKATAALCEQVKHEVFGSPSLSWGYAVMDSVDQSYNEVLSEADAMMYAQKKVLYQFRSSGLLPDKEIIQDRASVNSAGHISDEEYLIANEGSNQVPEQAPENAPEQAPE